MGSKVNTTTNLSEQVTNTQTTNTQQIDNSAAYNLDDVEGTAIAGNSGPVSVTQISTDQGAVAAGQKVAEAGLNFGRIIGGAALDTVGETSIHAIDAATKANDRSLDFGEAAFETSFSFGNKALDTVANTTEKALAAQASTTGKGFETLSGAIDKAAQATRSDSADTLQKIAKFGAIALAVIVVGGIVIATMRKG